jgi:hypothetical protein
MVNLCGLSSLYSILCKTHRARFYREALKYKDDSESLKAKYMADNLQIS